MDRGAVLFNAALRASSCLLACDHSEPEWTIMHWALRNPFLFSRGSRHGAFLSPQPADVVQNVVGGFQVVYATTLCTVWSDPALS